MQAAQIKDGMTLDGYVPGRGPFAGINFKFRPALSESAYDYLESDRSTGKKRLAQTIKLILGSPTSPHLREWDMTTDNGEPVKIDEASISRIPAPMLDVMLNIISLYALDEQESAEKN